MMLSRFGNGRTRFALPEIDEAAVESKMLRKYFQDPLEKKSEE